MLDMKIDDRVATLTDIPALLTEKGWDQAAVSRVWRVTSASPCYQEWNEAKMEELGGRGVLSRVWNELKDNNKTGPSNRCAEEDSACHPPPALLRLIVRLVTVSQ